MATAELKHFVRYGKKIAGAGLNYRYVVCVLDIVLKFSNTVTCTLPTMMHISVYCFSSKIKKEYYKLLMDCISPYLCVNYIGPL
jgi:hypothetical protein